MLLGLPTSDGKRRTVEFLFKHGMGHLDGNVPLDFHEKTSNKRLLIIKWKCTWLFSQQHNCCPKLHLLTLNLIIMLCQTGVFWCFLGYWVWITIQLVKIKFTKQMPFWLGWPRGPLKQLTGILLKYWTMSTIIFECFSKCFGMVPLLFCVACRLTWKVLASLKVDTIFTAIIKLSIFDSFRMNDCSVKRAASF